MRRSLLFVLFFISALQTWAQLTIQVTATPANTPANAQIYLAGSMNNWNAADPTKILNKNGTQYSITLTLNPGAIEFKFTRGSWASVEGNANGTYLPNRSYNYTGGAKTLQLSIQSWEDLGSGNPGTAASNVQILDNAFYIPQLNRTRRIWMYLPPDYNTANKSYPVLYMHDGQNLFDVNTTAFGVEWRVDESLNSLFQQGDYGCIVVGIDNGGASRLDEYSPWVNSQYGGGQGDEYLDFIVNTLKPYIDAHFRTLPGRNTTGIMGSSMGGLISMYALAERQDVFSKAGILSPAFWFAGNASAEDVATHPKQGDVRVYFVAGGDEPTYVAQDMQAVADAMTTAGFGFSEKSFTVVPGGQHSEWFWAQEFPDAYVWLFQGAVSGSYQVGGKDPLKHAKVYPNPADKWVRLSGVEEDTAIQVQIVGADGKVWNRAQIAGGSPIYTGNLPSGFYMLKVRLENGRWRSMKLVKE
ncbi:MAG: T9SS type A sorting domain-containing protein [Bacteroidetes bacterium]|nr:T9SS type A sorting domain-containing protein [Bacteroidota bacterium]